MLDSESTDPLDVSHGQGYASSDLGDAAIAGRAVELAKMRALTDLPAQRVLAPPAAHHENLHDSLKLGVSVPEMPESGQHDGDVVLVGCVDDLLVADAPARMRDGRRARLRAHLEGVRKRKESVRGDYGSLRGELVRLRAHHC